MAKKPTNPRLLPTVKYAPQGDGGRGGGDYSYYEQGNSYASNPDYAQNFGGVGGGGGTPPLLSPPQQDPPPQKRTIRDDAQNLWDAAINNINSTNMGYNKTEQSINNMLSPVGDYLFGQGGKIAYPENYTPKVAYQPMGPQMPADWNGEGYGRAVNSPPNPYATQLNGMGQIPPAPQGAPDVASPADAVGKTPPGFNPGPSMPSGSIAGPGNDQTVAAWQATLDKNRGLNDKATAAGDEKEMARLDAEWKRLTSSPIYQKMYGGQNEMDVKNRLINSYMQPGNDAAEPDFQRAHARMVTDDLWAKEMDAANAWGSDPARMWAEHWQAMNKGGRDPLEGHPQAIQNLAAAKKQLEQDNQTDAYNLLTQWQKMSGNV